MIKYLPNLLSVLRILLSLLLLAVQPLSNVFFWLYTACGLSDALDGFIARKFNAASVLGAKLDSVADFILTAVLIVKLLPVVQPSWLIIVWIGGIAFIRLTSMLIVYLKYKTIGMLHTSGNKMTGFMLFLFPFLLLLMSPKILMGIICAAATVSALEELLINCFSKELKLDQASFFQGGKSHKPVYGYRARRKY